MVQCNRCEERVQLQSKGKREEKGEEGEGGVRGEKKEREKG